MKKINFLFLVIILSTLSGCDKNYVQIGAFPKMKINPPASADGREYLHSAFQSVPLDGGKPLQVDQYDSGFGIVVFTDDVVNIKPFEIVPIDMTQRMDIVRDMPIMEFTFGSKAALKGYPIGGQSRMVFYSIDASLPPGRYQTPSGKQFDYKLLEYEKSFIKKTEDAFEAKVYQDAFNFASTVESFPSLAQYGKRMAQIKAEAAFGLAEQALRKGNFEVALSYAESAKKHGIDPELVALLRRYIELKSFWVGSRLSDQK